MEDTVSYSSVESGGDEFVVVNADPKLRIAGNGNIHELEKKMTEVLADDNGSGIKSQPQIAQANKMSGSENKMTDSENMSKSVEEMPKASSGTESPMTKSMTMLGDSVSSRVPMPGERTPQPSGSVEVLTDQEAVVFTGVTYLGSAMVNAPRSEGEINRNMAILNEQSQMAIPVTLSVPSHSEGIVHLIDPVSGSDISSYPIHQILFCARGPAETSERCCFAFTCSHGNSMESAIFQCHVFQCDMKEAQVGKILYTFATAFRRVPKSPSSLSETSSTSDNTYMFDVALEFREDDGRGNYSTCPKDKNVFKLRCNIEKKIIISVNQISPKRDLKIERCFGLLIAPGRNTKHSDMHLIDMVSMGAGSDGRSYIISGHWDPTDPIFQILNMETPKDTRIFITVAVDLVVVGIQEPVRFIIETKARIFPMNERFWYFNKKPHIEKFVMILKQIENSEVTNNGPSDQQYEVVSIETQSEIDRRKAGMALALSPTRAPPQNIQTPQDPELEDSERDEPLLSGSGYVSKEVTDEDLLESWHEALTKWHQNLNQRPRQIQALVRKGIPEALRGEVWQLLTGCHENSEMLEAYRILITKESPCEQVILRDINRTFPAHDYFRETGGIGQDSLYKISKAYSVYDEEVGYCQGLSFLAASLLLHMPEEQAFCVLVKLMFDYDLRDMFKSGFEDLHLKFYQLERLLQDQIPELFDHFMELGLEAHMYASQWFLTLFTAKFPLYMVFHILDLFLCEGLDVIFRVSLALLKTSKKDLMNTDFEGVLKYFRVNLPKKYRTEGSAADLLQQAIALKVNSKKLKKYEKEYIAMKEQELQQEAPLERLERENKRLIESNMRLEQENDDLAHELVISKISLRNELDTTEDRCEILNKELLQTKQLLVDAEEEKKRLSTEASQLKEMCRRELERAEQEGTRKQAIISDYKQICSQLSERLEKQQAANKEELHNIKTHIQACGTCNQLVSPDGQFKKIDGPLQLEEIDPQLVEKDRLIRELELELAQTKLALVESECKTQDLTHQLGAAITEIQASKNTWLQKTWTSLREVTNKKDKEGSSSSSASLKSTKDGSGSSASLKSAKSDG